LRIVLAADQDAVADTRRRLADYTLAIFVSSTAVRMSVGHLFAKGTWPTTVRIAAIGTRTASALEEAGLSVDMAPRDQFTSEALLALEPMQQVEGLRILIVRGEGGREHLADTLRRRGARVDYVEVYRRTKPDTDTRPVIAAWTQGQIDAVTISSNESLQNLHEMLGESAQAYLRSSTLIVGSQRTVELAASLGITPAPVVAANAADEAIVAALEAWWSSRQRLMPRAD
jgi:uroporphyrinogen-III synthase